MELKLIASALVLILLFGTIVYSVYLKEEKIKTVEVFANGELYTCEIIRNDSYDKCVSQTNNTAYLGELV